MAQDAVTKRGRGAPSKYRKEYCQRIIELGKDGNQPLVSLASELEVAKSTVQLWAETHEDFSVAYQTAKSACENYWLNLAKNRATGNQVNGSDTLIKWMLSAAHGYREAADINQTVTADVTINGKVDITFVDITP